MLLWIFCNDFQIDLHFDLNFWGQSKESDLSMQQECNASKKINIQLNIIFKKERKSYFWRKKISFLLDFSKVDLNGQKYQYLNFLKR